jgi:hypothetical protein
VPEPASGPGPASAPRPRVRRWLRRVAMVAVIVLAPVVAYSVWDYVELRRLIREIQAIRARGEPVEDRLVVRDYSRLSPDQQRAGDYYLAAAMLALHTTANSAMGPVQQWLDTARAGPAVGSVARPAAGARAAAAGTGVSTGVRSATGAGAGTTSVPATAVAANAVPAKLVDDLRRVVEASPEALALADKAALLDVGGLLPTTDTGNRMAGLRRLALLIDARTLSASLAGRGDEAIDSARSSIALRRVMLDMPWVWPDDYELPAIFSLTTPSAEALHRLGATLAGSAPPLDPAHLLLLSRAQFLSRNWHRYYGVDPEMPLFYTLPMRSVEETLLRPLISQRLVQGLRSWAAMVPATHLSLQQLQTMENIARARAQSIPEIGAAFASARSYATALALDRGARILIAIERYRLDHKGALPSSLAQLVPDYASAVPQDPFDDAPLRFRVRTHDYVVYSIGADHRDDDGDLTSGVWPGAMRDWAPRNTRGRDIGVRVLLRPAAGATSAAR